VGIYTDCLAGVAPPDPLGAEDTDFSGEDNTKIESDPQIGRDVLNDDKK
jgi:hypothetical protein